MCRFLFTGLLVLAAISVFPRPADAWGKFGHLTICDLAYRNLTPQSRKELEKLFQVKDGGILVKGKGKMEDRHYTSFNVGCLEEDEIPRKHPDDHFINTDRRTKSITTSTCPKNGDCVLSGIERDFGILKDISQSSEDRVFALMALGHWIGDIHQPLHVSFADDRGGNGIDVVLKGKCGTSKYRPNNLHAIWDNCLPEAGLFERVRQRADFKTTWGPRTITYRAVDTLQANTTLTDERSLVGTDPWLWADESFQITLDPNVMYCVMVDGSCNYSSSEVTLSGNGEKRKQQLDQAYLQQFKAVTQERIRKAGFRLAHLINLALDKDYKEPLQNSTQKP